LGGGTYSNLSNLPGLNNAGSIISGLLVAAITITLVNISSPSSSVNNWLITLSVTCELPKSPPLIGAIASISSKKIIQGAAYLAFLNISLTPFSDSPTHFDSNYGPFILMKLASLSFAAASSFKLFL
jgi:hypothetical protein